MHVFMMRMAKVTALAGGVVLITLILITCLSVLGREVNATLNGDFIQQAAPQFAEWILALGVGPINGDFELVETGIAFAIFSFLPLCQITSGHATVDIFTSKMSLGVNRFLRMVADVAFALVFALILWRLSDGAYTKWASGETTFLLQFPVWWGYALSLVAALVGVIVGVYVAAIRLLDFINAVPVSLIDEGLEK